MNHVYMACEDHKRHIFISLWSDKLVIKSMGVNFCILIKECLFCHNCKLAKICLSNEAKNTIDFCCKIILKHNSNILEPENLPLITPIKPKGYAISLKKSSVHRFSLA
jgi:hypothetical protein